MVASRHAVPSRVPVSSFRLLSCRECSRRGPSVLESSRAVARRELRVLASALQDASPSALKGAARAALLNDTFPQQ